MRLHVRSTLAGLAIAFCLTVAWGQVKNRFEKPKTLIHLVGVRWKDSATAAEKKSTIEALETLAGQTPGILRVWTKPLRIQPMRVNDQKFMEGFNAADPYAGTSHVYAIEFKDKAAEEAYAKSPLREKWINDHYDKIRELSISLQATN